jgi:hypothetical protein
VALFEERSVDPVWVQEYLLPVHPKYYGVVYRTYKPMEPARSSHQLRSLWIHFLVCDVPCDCNGTPENIYDGEAMQNLFREEL